MTFDEYPPPCRAALTLMAAALVRATGHPDSHATHQVGEFRAAMAAAVDPADYADAVEALEQLISSATVNAVGWSRDLARAFADDETVREHIAAIGGAA